MKSVETDLGPQPCRASYQGMPKAVLELSDYMKSLVFARMLRRTFPKAAAAGVTFDAKHLGDGASWHVAAHGDELCWSAMMMLRHVYHACPTDWDDTARFDLVWITDPAQRFAKPHHLAGVSPQLDFAP